MQLFLPILIRLLWSLFGAGVLTLVVMLSVPGNPLFSIATQGLRLEDVQQRADADLNSFAGQVRFLVKKVILLDFGYSRVTGEDISRELLARLQVTAGLAALAAILMLSIGLFATFLSGLFQGRWPDRFLVNAATLILATPAFWFGIVLISVFALKLRWFPVSGDSGLWGLFLPAVMVSLRPAAFLFRMMRASMLQELSKPYVQVARSKGLPEGAVVGWHVGRNLTAPLIHIFGLEFSQLLTGAVVAETLFSIKGFGSYIVFGIESRDYDIILVCVLVSVFLVTVFAALTDFLALLANPVRRRA